MAVTTTVLNVKDGNDDAQAVIATAISGNLNLVHNIGDPVVSGAIANVLPSSESQYAVAVALVPQNTAGPSTDILTGLTTATQIKSSEGAWVSVDLYNTTGNVCYIQMFALPSAGVTLGSTTPEYVIPIAGTSSKSWIAPPGLGAGGTGLTIASTTTATGATGASAVGSVSYL